MAACCQLSMQAGKCQSISKKEDNKVRFGETTKPAREPRALAGEFAREVYRRKIPPMKRENPTIEICPGITRRTVAHGNTMYQMLATLAAGSRMPAHSHPQEQIVHILEGKMRLIVEGVPHELSQGESFYLASNVSHGVETLSATRVLDTFSPPRSDYLAADEKVLHGAL